MKYFLIVFLFFTVALQAQTVALPTWVIDSAIYEIQKGRQCDNVMNAQQNEIEKLGAELMHVNKALDLKHSETQTLESLLSNSKEQGRVDKMAYKLVVDGLKSKIKRLWVWVVGEGGVIILMILLL